MIQIGFNARLFPNIWRPIVQEIHFATQHGFTALQIPGKEEGLAVADLGDTFQVVRQELERAPILPVMEILLRVDDRGYTASGRTPAEVLVANLPAIVDLNCRAVHFHFVPLPHLTPECLPTLEMQLLSSIDTGAILGKEWGFRFGLEHNERPVGLFATPPRCAKVLAIIPQLGFVWDINHTHPDDYDGFAAFLPRVSLLHLADTHLPETNEHLPLGMGNVNFTHFCHSLHTNHFDGPAILEIGGLPKSGGFGRDTDVALIDSLERFNSAYQKAMP